MSYQGCLAADFMRLQQKLNEQFDGVETKHVLYACRVVASGYSDEYALQKTYWVYGEHKNGV